MPFVRRKMDAVTAELELQRAAYEPHMREVADWSLPHRLRLQLSDQARGDRRNQKLVNSATALAIRTAESGMMSGYTSPAKRWFRFKTEDPGLMEWGPVKRWVEKVNLDILRIYDKGNVYQKLPSFYGNVFAFGLAAISLEWHPTQVVRARSYAPGSFYISNDEYGDVGTFWRKIRMTVRQLYGKFPVIRGDDRHFSKHVRSMASRGDWEKWVDVSHLVMPNEDYDPAKGLARFKRWGSVWWEIGSSETSTERVNYLNKDERESTLRASGFDSFPYHVGRWRVSEGDVYPLEFPGMLATGDSKSLQLGERRWYQAVDKITDPHWLAAAELEGEDDHGFLPGKITYIPSGKEIDQIKPLHKLDPAALPAIREKQTEVEQRIFQAYYYDLFRLLDFLKDRERTATEILERKTEKIVQLAPVLSQINTPLRQMIERTYQIMDDNGLVEEPPEDLQGQELGIQYEGLLAQAQREIHAQPIQRIFQMVMELAKVQPDALDKLDTDQGIDEIAKAIGAPARVVRDDAEVKELRRIRAEAQQAAQAAETMAKGAGAVKDLSQSPMNQDNALRRLVEAQPGTV